MRVICEKCRSAYAVDDALVPTSGVRSQCPRCRHIQLARPVRGGSGPKKVLLPEAEANEIEAAQIDRAMADAVKVGPAPGSTFAVTEPQAGLEANVPARQGPPPLPGARSAASTSDVATACGSCGKPLSDPFDQALGKCDGCRQAEKDQSALPHDLFDGHAHPETDAGGPLGPTLDSARRPKITVPQPTVITATRADASPSRRWPWVLGALVLAGAGAAAFLMGRGTGPTPGAERAVPKGIEPIVERLRARHPGLSGTRESVLARAEEKLLADTDAGYREARDLFEQLVALDPGDARAVAGWAEAVALAPSPDPQALADARAVADALPPSGRLDAARADLLLAQDDPDATASARTLAQKAVNALSGKDKAWGELALGRTYASSSGKLAVEAYSAALVADPAQRRGYVLRALVRESLGEYREARADLQNRLAMDPDHWEALDALARIELDGGEVAQASRLYQRAKEAHPSDLRPVLALAELHTFVEKHPEQAVQLLQAALKEHGNLKPSDAAAIHAQLAAAQRAQGLLTAGVQSAQTALEADPKNVTAHLQLALLSLDRGKPADAIPHLGAIRGKLDQPGVVELLEGRARFAQGDFAGALAAFSSAVDQDARRNDAALWAGVASAAAGSRPKAEEWVLRAAQADPLHLAPDPRFGPDEVPRADLLKGAEGVFAKMPRGDNDVMPDLLEGIVRYHQRDLAGAERYLRTVLASDTGNVIALSYLALLEHARNNALAAVQAGAKAVAFGRQFGIAHYAYGVALADAKQTDAAKRELEQVRVLSPALLAAEFQIAELDAPSAPEAARDRLVGLLAVDGAYGPARRALYQLDKE